MSEEEEVDLDPCIEFEEGRPTFDEPMTLVQLDALSHQGTRLVGMHTGL